MVNRLAISIQECILNSSYPRKIRSRRILPIQIYNMKTKYITLLVLLIFCIKSIQASGSRDEPVLIISQVHKGAPFAPYTVETKEFVFWPMGLAFCLDGSKEWVRCEEKITAQVMSALTNAVKSKLNRTHWVPFDGSYQSISIRCCGTNLTLNATPGSYDWDKSPDHTAFKKVWDSIVGLTQSICGSATDKK